MSDFGFDFCFIALWIGAEGICSPLKNNKTDKKKIWVFKSGQLRSTCAVLLSLYTDFHYSIKTLSR